MRSLRRGLWAVVAGLAVTGSVRSQDKVEEVKQGFRAYVVAEPRYSEKDPRNRTGKMPDLVAEHGLKPVVAVFSRSIPKEAANPLADILKKTDSYVENYKSRKFGAFLVFLALKDEFRKHDPDNSRDERIKDVKQFVNGAKPAKTTIGLAEATVITDTGALVPAQVTNFGIGPEDDLVIVFFNDLRVVKRWNFKAGMAPTAADLEDLDNTVATTLGIKKK